MNKLNKTTHWLLQKTVKEQVQLFLKLGYQEVTEKDMWEFLECYYWKKNHPKGLKEMKLGIREITPNDYFDYQRLKAMTKNKFEELDFLL